MQYNTLQELETKVKEYSELGFEILPLDEPQYLKIGYIVSKDNDETTEIYELYTNLVDCSSQKTTILNNIEDFISKFNQYKNNYHFYRSDQPTKLKAGFVTFDDQENIILTYLLSIKHLRQLPQDFMKEFDNLRNKSMANN